MKIRRTMKTLPCLTLFLLLALHAAATTFYVNASNPVPGSPFTTWSTAATNIQDAIDVSSSGDTILVTNGIYQAVEMFRLHQPDVTLLDLRMPGMGGVEAEH